MAGKTAHRATYIEMGISSLLSLIASLVLAIDAVVLAANPDAALSCDISAKVSCSTVGLSWQASLLGFPNAFLGLIFEPIVLTIVIAGLMGVVFPRKFMLGAQAIYTIAIAFAYWLFFQAYFVIGALCPWCLLVTVTTTLVFVSMTRINILEGNFGQKIKNRCEPALRIGADTWLAVLVTGIIAAMVLYRYV